MRRILSALGLAAIVAACAEPATQPDIPEALFAKPGPSQPLPPNQYGTVTLSSNPAPDGVGADYIHGACGVSVVIFYNNAGNDGVLQTDNAVNRTDSCGAWPRTFTIQTSAGTLTGTRISVPNLGGVADNSTEFRPLSMYFPSGLCTRLRWGSAAVTRTGNTFTVSASGATSCLDSKGRLKDTYSASANFTLVQRTTP